MKPYKSVFFSKSEFGDETLSYLEFTKYSIDEGTFNDTTREITYNDGVYYIFDVYGEMLNQKYDKQLEEIKEFNSKSNFDSELTSENVIMPTDSYKRPQHVTFQVSTVTPPLDEKTTPNNYGYESCDIRLTTVVP